MRVVSIAAAVALATTSIGGAAAAATITFDDVNPNPCCSFAGSYTSEGMLFTQPNEGLFFPPDANPFGFTNIDPGGASLVATQLKMDVVGGGTFDLLGFTFGYRVQDDPASGWIKLRFTHADHTEVDELFDIHGFAPETLAVSRTGLRRVTWVTSQIFYGAGCMLCTHTGSSIGSFAIDDVTIANVQVDGVATDLPLPHVPVPEPAGWALMILGFGAAGTMLRSRCVLA